MSDQSLSAGHAAVEVRKERVHTTMLIELLALMIFLAMAFAFVLKEEGDKANPWKEKYDHAQIELAAARKQIGQLSKQVRTLQIEVDGLQESLRRFIAASKGPIPANDQVVLSRKEYERLAALLANAEAVSAEQTRDNQNLRARIKGGIGLPACTVTAGPLLRVSLLAGGQFRAEPAWTAGAAGQVRTIPGLAGLTSGQALSSGQFRTYAGQVSAWAKTQSPSCIFRVRARSGHNDAQLFNRQVKVLEQSFYVFRE